MNLVRILYSVSAQKLKIYENTLSSIRVASHFRNHCDGHLTKWIVFFRKNPYVFFAPHTLGNRLFYNGFINNHKQLTARTDSVACSSLLLIRASLILMYWKVTPKSVKLDLIRGWLWRSWGYYKLKDYEWLYLNHYICCSWISFQMFFQYFIVYSI